jgi:hypothetical protein
MASIRVLFNPEFHSGAASLYLRGNGAPESRSSWVLARRRSNLLRGKSWFWEKSMAKGYPDGRHLKKFDVKTRFEFKRNFIWKYFELQIYLCQKQVSQISWDFPFIPALYIYNCEQLVTNCCWICYWVSCFKGDKKMTQTQYYAQVLFKNWQGDNIQYVNTFIFLLRMKCNQSALGKM